MGIGNFVKLRWKNENPQKSGNIIQAKTKSVEIVTTNFSSKVWQTKLPVNSKLFNCGAVYSTLTRFVLSLISAFRSISQSILHYFQPSMSYIICYNISILRDYNMWVFPSCRYYISQHFIWGNILLPEIILKFNANSAGFRGRNTIKKYKTCWILAVTVSPTSCLNNIRTMKH